MTKLAIPRRLEPKKIVVSGGAGFIGSHLCERLMESGHYVICVDNFQTGRLSNLEGLLPDKKLRVVEADVVTLQTERLGPVDEIYHLACPASPLSYQADPVHTMMTCVVGTGRLMEHAARHGARFLLTSTSEVYGDPEVHPQTEHYRGAVNFIGPRACYDEGKRAAEALAYDFSRARGACVRVARIFNTYGPRMQVDDGRVVPNFIRQALAAEPLTIYGDGEQTRSLCFVADVVDGLVRLMEKPERVLPPVNLGNPNERTVRELAQLIARLCGAPLRLEHQALPEDDPQRRRPDVSRARELLGWRPTTDLEAGLRTTIESFRERREADRLTDEAPPRAGAGGS